MRYFKYPVFVVTANKEYYHFYKVGNNGKIYLMSHRISNFWRKIGSFTALTIKDFENDVKNRFCIEITEEEMALNL